MREEIEYDMMLGKKRDRFKICISSGWLLVDRLYGGKLNYFE